MGSRARIKLLFLPEFELTRLKLPVPFKYLWFSPKQIKLTFRSVILHSSLCFLQKKNVDRVGYESLSLFIYYISSYLCAYIYSCPPLTLLDQKHSTEWDVSNARRDSMNRPPAIVSMGGLGDEGAKKNINCFWRKIYFLIFLKV